MMKKAIASLLIMGAVFSTVGVKANAADMYGYGWRQNADSTVGYADYQNGIYTNKWLQEDGKWYYFDKDGKMVKGWLTLGDKTYYLSEKGQMLTGWYCIGGPWFFFDRATGELATK